MAAAGLWLRYLRALIGSPRPGIVKVSEVTIFRGGDRDVRPAWGPHRDLRVHKPRDDGNPRP